MTGRSHALVIIMRLLVVFLFLAFLGMIPFLIWGSSLEATFSRDGAIHWLQGYGTWAWAAAIVLLLLDLFLPVPATAVFTGLGFIYGAVLGGLIGASGSILSGMLAYTGCRLLGREVAVRIAGERDLARGERLFRSVGGWVVALSRWLPIFAEVIACMAGLARMPRGPFLLALASGTLPLAMTFAAVGAAGVHHPILAIAISAGLPVLLWPIASLLLLRRRDRM